MPEITVELLRKRSEHNEGLISTLEELSLHQEELENINSVIGFYCKKIKILYLQNNIINKIENLTHLKELEYLNLALNNVRKIEGLQKCEFLRKLDLTLNFIDVDELEDSINHLISLNNLSELYMMGNPSQANWKSFESYIIGKLPQLQFIDGKEITKSMQIVANQQLSLLTIELNELADAKRYENSIKIKSKVVEIDENGNDMDNDPNRMTENTPEARIEIYKELAKQKKEKQDREKSNQPKERNYELEHKQSVSEIRAKEDGENEIKQKNEGGWDFAWDEDSNPGYIILEIQLQKFLDSSLIDVDIHPNYISIIIKNKLLRLKIPSEVIVSECKCQRSKLSGSLRVIMSKANSKEYILKKNDSLFKKSIHSKSNKTRILGPKKISLQDQLLAEVQSTNTSLLDVENKSILNIVKKEGNDCAIDSNKSTLVNINKSSKIVEL